MVGETIQFQQVIPILRIFDVPKADPFCSGFLGFSVDWNHRFNANAPLDRQISRNRLVLHLRGLREFHRELNASGSR